MLIKVKTIALCLLSVLITLMLSGCWDMIEIDKTGIIGAVGIDYENEQFKLTFLLNIPKSVTTSKSQVSEKESATYIETTGKSFFEAAHNASEVFGRELYWSNVKVYLLSERVAQKGILDFFEFVSRFPRARLHTAVFIARGGTIPEIMSVKGPLQNNPSMYIDALFDNAKQNPRGLGLTIKTYMFRRNEHGREGVVGILERIPKKPITTLQPNETQTAVYLLRVAGAGVFMNDCLIGSLNGDETRALNYINGNINNDAITINGPENEGVTSINVFNEKIKKEVKINRDKAQMNLEISLGSMLITEQTGKLDILEPETISKIEDAICENIKTQVEGTIKKVQSELKSDIFGFGEALYFKDPKQWGKVKGKWNEFFSKGKVNVKVKAKITRHGTVDYPIKREINE